MNISARFFSVGGGKKKKAMTTKAAVSVSSEQRFHVPFQYVYLSFSCFKVPP